MSALCLGSSASTTFNDSDVPLPGQVFFYGVRAVNGCPGSEADGSLGTRSNGAERVGRNCP